MVKIHWSFFTYENKKKIVSVFIYKMSSDKGAAALVVLLHIIKYQKKRKSRSHWVKPWLSKRSSFGVYDTLLQELRSEDEGEYKKFLHMSPDVFDELLNLIEEDITRQNTHLRESIPARVKPAATIRFLATGENYSDLQYQFRVHQSMLGQFIPELCNAIFKKLKGTYMKVLYFVLFKQAVLLQFLTSII